MSAASDPSQSDRRIAHYEQRVYRVKLSVPVPEVPDTWMARKDWQHLLERGSIVYTTKDYRVRGRRLEVTCDISVADGWDNQIGRPRPASAEQAISHVAQAVRFDVAWVQGRLHEDGYGTLPRLDDVRASARCARIIPKMTVAEREAERAEALGR